MDVRLSGHGIYRRRILNPGVKEYLERLFPKVLRDMPGCEIVELNIQIDHVHMVMIIPPKYAVSEVIGRMKGKMSSKLRKKFAWLEKVYWKENIVWSPGYFVSTVGIDEATIIKYVRWQESQDSVQASLAL
ncbi:MAG: IS200/IS605 family transposase [Dehalococcoidia bacterium]|nr:IS200/IS605 family transposase [Dehalococcoidia bacterium]